MSDINLTELLGNFERCCFQLAKQDSYEDYDDYLQTVYNHCANKLVDVFGSDRNILKRRIDEYIKDFYYRDPNTNIQKTFLEWSDFYNNQYTSKDNLFELYDVCANLTEEVSTYKQKIKEMEAALVASNHEIENLKSQLSKIQDDADEETEEEYDDIDYATHEDMKAEALFRMKQVIRHEQIIKEFDKDDLPQLYEPPFGASYALENNELEAVRQIENIHNVLVWGVIRCYMKHNKQDVAVDCMLNVSNSRKDWEQERKDLFTGCPFVFTIMYDYDIRDHGYINIYQSEGGTLLRDF